MATTVWSTFPVRLVFTGLLAQLLLGCEGDMGGSGTNNLDGQEVPQAPAPPVPPAPCPFVLDEGAGFTATLPCGVSSIDTLPLTFPGATYQRAFDDELGNFYLFVTVPVSSVVTTTSTQGNIRFDGTMQTASGDTLVLATGRGQTADLFEAFGLLANGDVFLAGVGLTQLHWETALVIFGSIDLEGTDGKIILAPPDQGDPRMVAPGTDGLVILDDQTAWRVADTSLPRVAAWNTGDAVFAVSAQAFFEDFFLTKIGEWRSVPAIFVDVPEFLEVTSIQDLEFDSTVIQLADGSSWRIAFFDENKVRDWLVGDRVALLEDPGSFLGYTIVRLATGEAVVVEPT